MYSTALNRILLAQVCVIVSVSFLLSAQEVPILNAGFETPDPELAKRPAYWGVYPATEEESARFVWSSEAAHTGNRSICITAGETSASWLPRSTAQFADSLTGTDLKTRIARVQPGREYVVSIYAKGEGSGQQFAAIALRWTKADGWTPKYEFTRLDLSDEWQLVSIAGTAPEGSEYLCPVLQLRGNADPGRVWFDDIAVADRTGLMCAVSREPRLTEDGAWTAAVDVANNRQIPVNALLGATAPTVFEPVPTTLMPGENMTVDVSYEATKRHQFAVVLTTLEGVPLFVERMQVRSIFDATLIRPRYRSTLLGDTAGQELSIRYRIRADETFREQILVHLEVPLPVGEPLTAGKSFPEEEGAINLDLPTLATGSYMCRADLVRGEETLGSVRIPFQCRPEADINARIGDLNELIVDGKRLFPIGFYSVTPADYARLKKDGFNFSLTYNTKVDSCAEMARQADEAGLKLIAAAIQPEYTQEQVTEAVRGLADLPGLLGYYLCDEPSLGRPGTAPDEMAALYGETISADPGHITSIVFCQPDMFDKYAETMDVFMVDPYPCRRGQEAELTMVADYVDAARKATRDRKPVWLVPQAFDHLVGPGNYRMPTVEEQRCMCYLGLVHGIKGLCWFTYTGFCVNSKEQAELQGIPHYWVYRGSIPECFPIRYAGMLQIIREIRELEGVWLAAETDQYQEIVDGKGILHHLMRSTGPETYLFVVNPSREDVAFSCRLPEIWTKAEVLWEDRSIDLEEQILRDTFAPLQVHAYRLR